MALNGRVLLLNQTYEPLGTVSVARAIIMTFKNTVPSKNWMVIACCVRRASRIPGSLGNSSSHLHQRASSSRSVGA